jgi:hypothetical protein
MATIRVIAVALVCGVVACSSEPSMPADAAVWQESMKRDGAGVLDGKSFACEMSDGAGETTDEVIEFHGGRFHSQGCDEHGFASGSYAATATQGTTVFSSVTTSATEGRIDWRGMVRGDAVEGSAIWSKPGQSPINYTFKGNARPAGSP